MTKCTDAGRYASRCDRRRCLIADRSRHVFQPVLGDERQVVALVEDLAGDLGISLAQPTDLPVLLGHELLAERRDLDVEVVLRQEEVRGEALQDPALAIPLDVERRGLVLPSDAIELQELGELALGRVCEAKGLTLGWCLVRQGGCALTSLRPRTASVWRSSTR